MKSGMTGKCLKGRDKEGGETEIEKYLEDGGVNEGQKLTLGWKLRYMKNRVIHSTTKSPSLPHFLPSLIPIFRISHL